jgi:hypothetical protein
MGRCGEYRIKAKGFQEHSTFEGKAFEERRTWDAAGSKELKPKAFKNIKPSKAKPSKRGETSGAFSLVGSSVYL